MASNYTIINNLVEEIPDIPVDSIISRTIFSDDQVKAVLFGFAPGQELSEHTASTAAVLYVVEGKAEIKLGDDRLPAQPGTYVHMESHLPHSIKAETSVVMLLLLLRTG